MKNPFFRFVRRNLSFAASNVRNLPEVRKAMKEVDKEFPKCAFCGREGNTDIHHVVPVSVDPTRAADKTNLIPLCGGKPDCHFVVGHLGNWKTYNKRVELTCATVDCNGGFCYNESNWLRDSQAWR